MLCGGLLSLLTCWAKKYESSVQLHPRLFVNASPCCWGGGGGATEAPIRYAWPGALGDVGFATPGRPNPKKPTKQHAKLNEHVPSQRFDVALESLAMPSLHPILQAQHAAQPSAATLPLSQRSTQEALCEPRTSGFFSQNWDIF